MMRQKPQVVTLVRCEALDPVGCTRRIGTGKTYARQSGTQGRFVTPVLCQVLLVRVARRVTLVHIQVRFIAYLECKQPIADSMSHSPRFGDCVVDAAVAQIQAPD